MEKVEKYYLKQYPILRIFKQDIKEITNIFKQNYEKIQIIADGYKLNDITELDNINKKEITDFSISSENHLSLSLSNDSAHLYLRNDEDTKARGIASRIDTILSKRVNRNLKLLTSFWMSMFVSVLFLFVYLAFPFNENGILKVAIIVFFIIIYLYWIKWSEKVTFKNYCLIYLYDSSPPSFFERNKDKIILNIIFLILGALITSWIKS